MAKRPGSLISFQTADLALFARVISSFGAERVEVVGTIFVYPFAEGWNVQLRAAMRRGSRECRIIHKDKTATLDVAQGHTRCFSGRRRCRSSYSKQTRIERPTDLGERAALIYLCSVLLLLDEKRGIKQQKVIAIIIPHDDAAVARSCGDDAFRRAYGPLGRSLFYSSNHKV